MTIKTVRWLSLAATLLVGAFAAGHAEAADKVVRIAHQKLSTLALLRTTGQLEEKLKALGYKVTWTEFPAGPQLLEALNVGAVDFGHTGEAPPVFAQAAGANLLYVGYEPGSPTSEAILVPNGSAITSVADLRGKRVALNKGSNVHYLLVRAWSRRACNTVISSRCSCRRPTHAPPLSRARSMPG